MVPSPTDRSSLPAPAAAPGSDVYDVAIVGGALAGAAAATVLLQKRPDLRVLIIERSAAFERRVGESTIEISTFFLMRVLGLTDHLNEHHYVKQGLRFWFTNLEARKFDDCSEIGSRFLARVPAFMVDRAVLDEEVLKRAMALGAECRRPAHVVKIELEPGGRQRLTIRHEEGTEQNIQARWVVDASGLRALLARQEGWYRRNEDHPTAAVWSRWTGVKHFDGAELQNKYPQWAAAQHGMRHMATNHLMGDGWWSWMIPLKGGDMSIGLVWDQRLVSLPPGSGLGQRCRAFLLANHPMAGELLEHASLREDDINYRRNLAYASTTFAGDGFALVGDAAGFIDPFYSPGLDWLAYTTLAAADVIVAERNGEADVPARLERYNRDFVRASQRWFEAIYQDKYEYMGDYELFRMAFLLDLGLYYLFVASQPFLHGADALTRPIYSLPISTPFYRLMRLYNRRCAAMARVRRARGLLGGANAGHRFLFPGFTFAFSGARQIGLALGKWLWLEVTEGWRSWGAARRATPERAAAAVAAPAS
jgi:flavin-dependent dehydrogenase